MKKFKIKANKEQLENIGIPYDITGLIGEFVMAYPTGWYRIRAKHTSYGTEYTNDFDIPKTFLQESFWYIDIPKTFLEEIP